MDLPPCHVEFGKNRSFTAQFQVGGQPYQFEYNGDDRDAIARDLEHRIRQVHITVSEWRFEPLCSADGCCGICKRFLTSRMLTWP